MSELTQLGVSSRMYEPGPYSELESMIAAWDREYLLAVRRTGVRADRRSGGLAGRDGTSGG